MIFGLLLPLFLMGGLGCLLTRMNWLKQGWQHGLAELTSKVLIPALLFDGAYRSGLPAGISWQLLGSFFLPLILVFGLALRMGPRDAGRALAACYSNTAFVGIPVIGQALGTDSLRFVFPVIAFHGLIGFSLYYYAANAGGRPLASLATTLKNPIVASVMLGLACNLLGVPVPAMLSQLLTTIAAATLPCALLSLGAALAGFSLRNVPEALAVSVAKLVVLPALVWLAARALDLPGQASAVLILMAASPVGINAGLVVGADGADSTSVNGSVLLSSLLAMLSMPCWLAFILHYNGSM